MHILVADGDDAVLQSLELMLQSEGMRVYAIDSGREAEELGSLYDYDAIVLSETEDRTPYDVVRSLRSAKIRTPILVLSSRPNVESIVQALDAGADDYMIKPFHGDELAARMHALVRRSKGHAASKIEIGNVVLNLDAKSMTIGGAPVHFTGKEYLMLETLALRIGQVQRKEAFLNALYGGRDEPDAKIVEVFMCKLRKKLTAAGAPDLVKTVWGRGYLIEKPGTDRQGPSMAPEIADLAGSRNAYLGAYAGTGNTSKRHAGAL